MNRRTWWVFGTLMVSLACFALGESRPLVFIGDTHFGVGRDGGRWHSFEDARWSPDFAAFLQHLSESYEDGVTLIVNGDVFELWQSPRLGCGRDERPELGCSEEESLARLRHVLRQHGAELGALGKFANHGENRLVLIPGNHDAALLLESHRSLVLQGIGAAAGRVRIEARGYWISDDGSVYAEHGHQIGRDTNRLQGWPRPFLREAGKLYLERSWGEQFVQQFYNDFEEKYPIIDNFSSETLGIKYGLAAEGIRALPGDLVRFLRFYLLDVSAGRGARHRYALVAEDAAGNASLPTRSMEVLHR